MKTLLFSNEINFRLILGVRILIQYCNTNAIYRDSMIYQFFNIPLARMNINADCVTFADYKNGLRTAVVSTDLWKCFHFPKCAQCK